MLDINRDEVVAHRIRAQQLDRAEGDVVDTAALDLGIQDTGADGALWALANRGVDVANIADDALATVWSIRGAPHVYRRSDLPDVAAAVAPMSDADAGKRIFDASKPLKAAGIGNLDALDAVAQAMHSLVDKPMVKGDMSGRLSDLMPEPYLRFCQPCDAIHLYEQPFRLAALRAGLELQAGTSPPVLEPIPGFVAADAVQPQFDVIRGYLRLLGPASHKHVADYLDAPPKDVKAHWPEDVSEVSVEGEKRFLLEEDVRQIASKTPAGTPAVTRLLGPFDPFLQAKDRATLVTERVRAKELWPSLGRPGAVLAGTEIAGTWRPRKSGTTLTVRVELWRKATKSLREEIDQQAERLADHRGVTLKDIAYAD